MVAFSMKRHNDQTFQEVLKELLNQRKIREPYRQQLVERFWKEKMSPLIIHSTASVRLQKRVLYISLTSAALKQELHYHLDQILEKVNVYLDEEYVKEIRLL